MSYVPSPQTLDFMIWRTKYLPPHENKTPITHYKMLDYYFSAEPNDFKLVECFRGLGKSQIAMEFSLYCVCAGIDNYVLVVGATQDLSNDLVASAGAMLEDASIPGVSVHRMVEGILEIKRADGDIGYIVAKSTGSKLRGVAKGKKRYRPTRIVLDDITSDDIVQNRVRMARANRWIASALLPTLAPGGTVIGSGTPQHESDPFMTLVASFGSFKVPISDTAFPDRFTPEYIAQKKAQYEKLGQLTAWKQEMELVLADEENRVFDTKQIKFCREDELPSDLCYFATLDGAFSEQAAADSSAITVLGVDQHQNWYAIPYIMKAAPNKVADKLLELVAAYSIDNVGIEKGAFKLSIGPYLEEQMLAYQTWFTIHDLNTAGSKLARVKALSAIINTGRLTIVDRGEDSETLMEQIELTTHSGIASSHDDAIDSLAQCLQLDTSWYPQRAPQREDYSRRPRANRYN